MAVPAETLAVKLHEQTHPFPTLAFVDRRGRKSSWRAKTWVLVRGIERVLYGVQPGCRSTGRFATFLSACTMRDAVLVAERGRVVDNTLTQSELDAGAAAATLRVLVLPCAPSCIPTLLQVPFDLTASSRARVLCSRFLALAFSLSVAALGAMRQLVEPEGRSRVTKASLLPVSVAVAALTQFGREDGTAAILKSMRKLPRRYEACSPLSRPLLSRGRSSLARVREHAPT